MEEKRKFGGAQLNAGRKPKSKSGLQKPVTFGAAPDCIATLERLIASGKHGTTKGAVICAALALLESRSIPHSRK